MEIARQENVTVPAWAPIRTSVQLTDWIKENGTPAVLKADCTGGGRGVRVIETPADSHRIFRLLSRSHLIRVLKRLLVNGDSTVVLPFILRRRPKLTAQTFIPGKDATISISCWNGSLLAGTAFEVIKTGRPNGPASVVRVIDNWQMFEAAARLARRLNLSGLFGLDFRLDGSNCAYLIEMNPRATQSSHLRIGENGDLVGSLVSAFSGREVAQRTHAPLSSAVTFFPNEWQKDPGSAFLYSGYHDVPWSEPDLVRALMKKTPLPDRYL